MKDAKGAVDKLVGVLGRVTALESRVEGLEDLNPFSNRGPP